MPHLYPSICQEHLGCSHDLVIVNSAAMNTGAHIHVDKLTQIRGEWMNSAFAFLLHKLQKPKVGFPSTSALPTPVDKMKQYILKAIYFLSKYNSIARYLADYEEVRRSQ